MGRDTQAPPFATPDEEEALLLSDVRHTTYRRNVFIPICLDDLEKMEFEAKCCATSYPQTYWILSLLLYGISYSAKAVEFIIAEKDLHGFIIAVLIMVLAVVHLAAYKEPRRAIYWYFIYYSFQTTWQKYGLDPYSSELWPHVTAGIRKQREFKQENENH